MSEVIVTREGAVGRLALNRPQAIHALTLDMVRAMTEALVSWRGDAAVQAVVIDHAEGRGFCAGGDIGLLRKSALEDGGEAGRRFFFEEYRLNHLIFAYPKPVIAFMDGITMGGGVGISQPTMFRIATENTRLAMPETGIGLFPDVGGGWYLSRLPGRLGQFLALTGARLDGSECLWAGLASHYLPHDKLETAKARIADHPDRIAGILAELSDVPPAARIEGNAARIAKLFASNSYEDILAALEADGGEWAEKELATLRTKSPQACKIALRLLAESGKLGDFADEMRMEYRVASRVLVRPDFAEGVRALIVDKTNDPHWNPARPEDVSDALLDAMFAPLPQEEEWSPL